jgi:hypothetical protein
MNTTCIATLPMVIEEGEGSKGGDLMKGAETVIAREMEEMQASVELAISQVDLNDLGLPPEGQKPSGLTKSQKRAAARKRKAAHKRLEDSSHAIDPNGDHKNSPALPGGKPVKKNKTSESGKQSQSKVDGKKAEVHVSKKPKLAATFQKPTTSKPNLVKTGQNQKPFKVVNSSDGGRDSQKVTDESNLNHRKEIGENENGRMRGQKRKLETSNSSNHSSGGGKKKTFSEVARADLTVLIRIVGLRLSNEQTKKLRANLCERLDATDPGANRPCFESNFLTHGALNFVCANNTSRDWLLKQITEMEELDGAKLVATTAQEESLRTKLTMTIHDHEFSTEEQIFTRLKGANVGLDTSKWRILRTLRDDHKGRTILVSVDDASRDFILSHGKKLYYQLQRLYVDVRAPSKS